MSLPGNDKRKRREGMVQAGMMLGAGLQFAVTIMIATAGGWWLDGKLSTSPFLLIAGMLFGATAAFYHLYKGLTQTQTGGDQEGSPPRNSKGNDQEKKGGAE